MMHRALGVLSAAALAAVTLSAQGKTSSHPEVDAVFARFNEAGSPGCAVAVIQNHAIAYEHGYGRASIELDVPITPQTVFDIGSDSKQFTALALLLLERDGKLSLDDDVRRFVPQVPDYGTRITIRHLLTHTSGLRDYTDMMDLDGHDTEDYTSDDDALDIIARQRGVNFAPGDEWRYCNTGFFLASIVVKRASGQTLADFARDRIFVPLGMTSTQYLDDTTRIVPRRATAYSPRAGAGFRVNMSDWNQIGDGSIQTTVEDLARWDENFYAPKVGDARMIDAMQTAGTLNNGKRHEYGLGLLVDTYGGLKRVYHGGSWAGYRAQIMRFPEQRTSFVTLCNVSNAAPQGLAERVAAVWLKDAGLVAPSPPAQKTEAAPTPPAPSDEQLRAYVGRYAAPDLTLPWNVEVVDHQLHVRNRKADGRTLRPVAPDAFSLNGYRIEFERDSKTKSVTALTINSDGVKNLRLVKQAIAD